MEFRKLKASEIECKVSTVKNTGFSIVLYKDARVDMVVLDETVGNENWFRDHKEVKGNVYCGIGIKVITSDSTSEWVTKWDAGAESFSDKEKGEASDSFKRAGFNWGIGRELYTSPFIWIKPKDEKEIYCKNPDETNQYKKRYTTSKGVKMYVDDVEYTNNAISYLNIIDQDGKQRYRYGQIKPISKKQIDTIEGYNLSEDKLQKWLTWYKVTLITELEYRQAEFMIEKLKPTEGK